jgi:hypothetical protein
MKSYKQFISESVNISGDFKGNLYINSQPEKHQVSQVGEEYVADILWKGSLYRMELSTESGIPSNRDLGEQLQNEYPGAVVHQIYPKIEKNINIKDIKRYHPSKLEWIE